MIGSERSAGKTSVFGRGIVVFPNLEENFALNETVAKLVQVHDKRARDIPNYDSWTHEPPTVISFSDGAPQTQTSMFSRNAARAEMQLAKKGQLFVPQTSQTLIAAETPEPEVANNDDIPSSLVIDIADLAQVGDFAELRVGKSDETNTFDKTGDRVSSSQVAKILTSGRHDQQIGTFHVVMNGAGSGLQKLHPDESTAHV